MLKLSCSNISESFFSGGTNILSYESRKVGPFCVNSKGFFMFSIADVSTTIDFLRVAIDEGVIHSLLSMDIRQTLGSSASSLKSSKNEGIYRSLCDESSRYYRGGH
jgi:hypothetical protein